MQSKLTAELLAEPLKNYPLPSGSRFVYGTSGFRTIGATLPAPSFRVGFVTALRSMAHKGKAVGLMVTASHNAHHDNGLKIVDANAGMLDMKWEPLATEAANAQTLEALLTVLADILTECAACDDDGSAGRDTRRPRVHVGCDTRATSPAIVAAVQEALRLVDTDILYHGVVTTPQLHAMVYMDNHKDYWPGATPVVDDYYAMLDHAAGKLFALCPPPPSTTRKRIVVDCANGVGTVSMQQLLQRSRALDSLFEVILVNTAVENPATLNAKCGADHVQKAQTAPEEVLKIVRENPSWDLQNTSFYSLDGDADRIVALVLKRIAGAPSDQLGSALLDGDRICILLAVLFRELCLKQGLSLDGADIGVVQTAYANGASTHYVAEKLKLATYCTATGVKYLHPVAEERDVGLYFEANGHGTVLLNHRFLHRHSREHPWLVELSRLLSQCCGDAVCDLFACELALAYLGWSATDWLNLYDDLPSLQTKVTVRDPSAITNTQDQRRALTPLGLQEAVDALVKDARDPSARSFVRPSGTEPIVRTYTEATTKDAVLALSAKVEAAVLQFCP